MARAFNGDGDLALMARAGPRLAAGPDFAPLVDQAAQQLGVFVINGLVFFSAELANAHPADGATATIIAFFFAFIIPPPAVPTFLIHNRLHLLFPLPVAGMGESLN